MSTYIALIYGMQGRIKDSIINKLYEEESEPIKSIVEKCLINEGDKIPFIGIRVGVEHHAQMYYDDKRGKDLFDSYMFINLNNPFGWVKDNLDSEYMREIEAQWKTLSTWLQEKGHMPLPFGQYFLIQEWD